MNKKINLIISLFLTITIKPSQNISLMHQKKGVHRGILDIVTDIKPLQTIILSYLNNWISDKTLMSDQDLWATAFSLCGNFIALGFKDGTLNILHLSSQSSIKNRKQHYGVISISYSPCGNYLALATIAEIVIFNIKTDEEKKLAINDVFVGAPLRSLSQIAYSVDGMYLACAAGNRIFTLHVGSLSIRHFEEGDQYYHIANIGYSPDGNFLTASDGEGNITIINLVTRNTQKFRAHNTRASCVYAPCGQYIASTSAHDREVKIWDVRTCTCIKSSKSTDRFDSVSYTPCGKYLILSGKNVIKIWNLENDSREVLAEHADYSPVAISKNGQYIVFSALDQTINMWKNQATEIIEASRK